MGIKLLLGMRANCGNFLFISWSFRSISLLIGACEARPSISSLGLIDVFLCLQIAKSFVHYSGALFAASSINGAYKKVPVTFFSFHAMDEDFVLFRGLQHS